MAGIDPTVVRAMAYKAGFRGSSLDTIVGIAGAESSFDPSKTHWNPPSRGRAGSWDLGLVQINATAWPTFFQRFNWRNPQAELNYAYSTISKRGTDFTAWATYNNGAYRTSMNAGTGGGGGAIDNIGGGLGAVGGGLGSAIPGAGFVAGVVGAEAGTARNAYGAVTDPTGTAVRAANAAVGTAESAAANLIKWVAPHAILIGGAALALILLVKQFAPPAMPVPV